MLFPASATVEPAIVGPDPAASPGLVPDALLARFGRQFLVSQPTVIPAWLVLDAPAAETVTLDAWVLDDGTDVDPGADDPTAGLADRRFYLLEAAITLTGGELYGLASSVPLAVGTLYLRVTADTLTQTRIVRGSGG
jgi:hypothetical protein